MRTGRPTLYNDQIIVDADEYINDFKSQGDAIPSVAGLSRWLKVSRDSLYEWSSRYPTFSDTLEKLLAEQERLALNMGITGEWNGTICKLVLSNHGMIEKKQIDNVSTDGSMSPDSIDATKLSSETIKDIMNARDKQS